MALPSQNHPPLVVVMSGAGEEPGLAMVVLGNFGDKREKRNREGERGEKRRERERELLSRLVAAPAAPAVHSSDEGTRILAIVALVRSR